LLYIFIAFKLTNKVSSLHSSWNYSKTAISTLNRGIKGNNKLNGLLLEKCRCLKHGVQPQDNSISIDVYERNISI